MKKLIHCSHLTVVRGVLIDVYPQNAMHRLVQVEHFVRTVDSNYTRMPMYTQPRLRKKVGDYLQENLYLRDHLLCSMWERYFQLTQIWVRKESKNIRIRHARILWELTITKSLIRHMLATSPDLLIIHVNLVVRLRNGMC